MTAPGALVLVVEDDPPVRKLVLASLGSHGYRTIDAHTGEAAVQLAEQYSPELMILDLGLPDMDGLEIINRVRAWSRLPIIILSARTLEAEKVIALDAGADDYLSKPFGVDELLARVRVVLRRSMRGNEPASPVFVSGALLVDLEHRRVTLDGQEIDLTAIEYKLLAALVEHAGKVVTHKQLLEQVWGPHHGEQTQYLRVYMAHLRRKLEPDPLRPRLFSTETGVGYRLRVDG